MTSLRKCLVCIFVFLILLQSVSTIHQRNIDAESKILYRLNEKARSKYFKYEHVNNMNNTTRYISGKLTPKRDVPSARAEYWMSMRRDDQFNNSIPVHRYVEARRSLNERAMYQTESV